MPFTCFPFGIFTLVYVLNSIILCIYFAAIISYLYYLVKIIRDILFLLKKLQNKIIHR